MGAIRVRLLWALDGLERVAHGTCQLAVSLMTGLVLFQVLLRYVFRAPLAWVEEATIFLMIWMTFIGAGIALRRGSHVAMTLLSERFPPRLTRWMFFLSQLAMFVFLSVVIWQGWSLAMSVEGQRSAALGIPMTWPYLTMPIGAGFMASQLVAAILEPVSEGSSSADGTN